MPAASQGSLLVVVFPGCAYLEVAAAVAWQSEQGAVRFASPDGSAVAARDGVRLAVDHSFASALALAPRAVLVPGGELDAVSRDDVLAALLRHHAARDGVIVGGICNGALLLARAGILAGRRCTHTAVDRYAPLPEWAELRAYADPLLRGSVYVDRPVVVDGPVITAKPWAAIAFAAELAVALGTDSPVAAARRAAYLRGERLPPEETERLLFSIDLRAGELPMSRALVDAHVAFLRELDREGCLVLAGPLRDRAAGRIVIRAASLAEAQSLAERDPFVTSGARLAEVTTWEISSEANAHMGIAKGPLGG